jgi:hypothetical protein
MLLALYMQQPELVKTATARDQDCSSAQCMHPAKREKEDKTRR